MRWLALVRRNWLKYAIAVLTAGAAAALRSTFTPWFGDRSQLVMFYPAIMLSAWCGGLWPGIVSTAVSAALDAYLFLEPGGTFRVTHHSDKLALAIFAVTGIVISVLNENLRRVAAREQAARCEADAANRTKDLFMAAVSHDLRAPMTAALGWAEMLTTQALDERQRERAVEAIRRAMSRQTVLVNDLVDHAAILSGKLRVERKPVDVDAVVRSAVEMAEPLAAAKRLRLTLDCDDGQRIIMGDAARLQQVVSNLLANAIKFTPESGEVHARLRRADSLAEIEIHDTGRGISPEALPFVFERFWQDETTDARRSDGVGLGLSIARELVTAHGGSIQARSSGAGQGATFTVRLPLAVNLTASVASHGSQRLHV
jgi:K+-sensing histidine kinase KdpD